MKSMYAFATAFLLLAACGHAPGAGSTPSADTADASSLLVRDLRAQVIKCTEAAVESSGLPVKASFHDFYAVSVDVDAHALLLWTDTQKDDELQIEEDVTTKANTDLTMGKGGRYYTKTADGYRQNGLHVRFCNDCFNGSTGWTWLTLGESLPYYAFVAAPSALGETTGDGRKVESFSIVEPTAGATLVPLVNVDTGLTTDYALDVAAFESCLDGVTPAL
jgi:hypothetical protein